MFGLFRKHETDEEIKKRILDLCEEGDYGICPPPMKAEVAISELANFFLGENWYSTMPLGSEQIITEIVYEIETNFKNLKATN